MSRKCNYLSNSLLVFIALVIAQAQAHAQTYNFNLLGDAVGHFGAYAVGINNSGVVVGSANEFGGATPFIWNGVTTTYLGSPYGSSGASAINNSGVVTGRTYFANGGRNYAGTIINDSVVSVLPSLGGQYSGTTAINDSGVVVGFSTLYGDGVARGVIWNGANATALSTFGGSYSGANAINNLGVVAGYSSLYNEDVHGAVWSGSNAIPTDLGTLGSGSSSWANGINNAGTVVGYSTIERNIPYIYHATLWDGLTVNDLGTLNGGTQSKALAINASDTVVGWSNFNGMLDSNRAVVWSGTILTDLNSFLTASEISAGWVLQQATDINDQGVIVGNAKNTLTGRNTVFMLAPVPEPETYAMMLAGLGLIGGMARRRKQKVMTA